MLSKHQNLQKKKKVMHNQKKKGKKEMLPYFPLKP
jgi:hypothetical protein